MLGEEKLISARQAAAICAVTVGTVRSWFRRGLESVKVGGRRRTSVEALRRFSGQAATIPPKSTREDTKWVKQFLGI